MRTRAALPTSSRRPRLPQPAPAHRILENQRVKEGVPIAGLAPFGTVGAQHTHPDTGWWAGSWLVPFTFGNLPKLSCTVSLLPPWL